MADTIQGYPTRFDQIQSRSATSSRNDYACHSGVVIAGSAIDVASPVVDVDMFHYRSALRDRCRDKHVVLEQV